MDMDRTHPASQIRHRMHDLPLAGSAATVLARARAEADSRRARPWVGVVGMGLATTAALLTDLPLALPLCAVCAWWWSPREPFVWLLPLGAGAITVGWVTVGTGLMAILPRPSAGLLWMASAAWFADLAVLSRALADRRRP